MKQDFRKLRDPENIRGASALIEVAAMARVGILSAGADLTGKRASQMERDAQRQERRGKTARANELKMAAAQLNSVELAMTVQREREEIRPLDPPADTALVQGRASKGGVGRAGLNVRLVDPEGKVLDATKSAANGAFALKHKADVPDARILVVDVDGTELGRIRTPMLKRAKGVFVDVPLERLDQTPGRDTDPAKGLTMPRVLGKSFADITGIFDEGLTLGDITLERARGKAGIVLHQSPPEGAPVKRGTEVELRVGAGKLAEDARTARALVRLQPEIAEAGLDARTLESAEDALGLAGFKDLAKLPGMKTAAVAEALPGGDERQAKVWQGTVARVLALFPGR